MATRLPDVTVKPIESRRFLITCDRCPRFHTIRSSRILADQLAVEHRASHQTPTREED